MTDAIDRRRFLAGRVLPAEPAPLDHVSSAVITVKPERLDEVVARVRQLPGTEVPTFAHAKIVVVFEAASSHDIAERLSAIALMDGVISANIVLEHTEPAS
jgi:nitrate reductase NapD